MVKLWRTYKFEWSMGHTIAKHPICGNPHGHNYRAEINIAGDSEYFVDFHFIKEKVDGYIRQKYDHKFHENLTCEDIVIDLKEKFSEIFGTAVKVTVWETDSFSVSI